MFRFELNRFEGGNIKKIIISNAILFLLTLIIFEIISFFVILFRYYPVIQNGNAWSSWKSWFSLKQLCQVEDATTSYLFPYRYKGTEDSAVVLLGCSYAWGAGLKYSDKPSSQLAKYLKNTVYNKSICSTGTSSVLYIMSQDKIKKEIPKAKYFVYIFLIDHLRRNSVIMQNHLYNQFSAKYALDKNGDLKFIKLNRLQYLFYSSYLYRLWEERKRFKQDENDYLLFGAIMDKLSATIKEKYPDSEFIVLFYDDNFYNKNYMGHNKKLDDICKRNNIKLIYTSDFKCGKDIFDKKYIGSDQIHPTKEAWEKIIPEFVEVAGIKKRRR